MSILKIVNFLSLVLVNYIVKTLYPLGPANYIYSGKPLIQPKEIISSNGKLDLKLTVDICRFKSFISFTTRCYYLDGVAMIPGPTIRLTQGDKLSLTLFNNLKGGDDSMNMNNMFHGANVTNIHTHGLHVDPNEDSIFKLAKSGESINYNLIIPEDHAPGVHWYHSHKHGASALQVMGGLYGAVTVEVKDKSQYPQDLLNLTRNLIHFSHFSTKSQNTASDPFAVRTYVDYINLVRDIIQPEFVYENQNYQDIYLTNGQFQPTFSMKVNQNYIFDLIHSSGDHFLELEIRTGFGQAGVSDCRMVLLAIDGVYLKQSRIINFLVMVPGQRNTIIISCNNPGTYYFQTYSDQVSRDKVADYEIRFNQNLLTLNVNYNNGVGSLSIPDISIIKRPDYLNDLINYKVNSNNIWGVSVDQAFAPRDTAWLGIGKDCSSENTGRADGNYNPTSNKNCKYLPFPGQLGDKNYYRHISKFGEVEELVINGRGFSPHTFHLHVNHVQIISFISPDGRSDDFTRYFGQIGDWRDTVPALAGKVIIRYVNNRFKGEVILHCHFLFHEDMGMMASIFIGDNQCSYPDSCNPGGASSNNNVNNLLIKENFIKYSSIMVFLISLLLIEIL